MRAHALPQSVPKVELEYICKKCNNSYPATVTYSGRTEGLELEETQARCPYCGEWNCADPKALEQAVKDEKKHR